MPQRSIEQQNREALASPKHPNAGAFMALPPDRRPAPGEMLEALDKALGGRRAVSDAIGRRVIGLPSGYRAFALAALWEEHCCG